MTDFNKIKTLIVDDEIAFINTMEVMLKPFKRFEICGRGRSVKEGIELVESTNPDVIFLDVELGDGTGFDVLKNIINRNHIKIIFVTAFDHYAVQAFRYSAIDYLLKPVVKDDLIMAIEKTEQLVVQENLDFQYKILLNNIKQNVIEKKRIVLKEVNTHHILQIDDIVMCVAQGSYTQFILESGESIIISRHLKEFEELLPNPTFFRVHRSYLINLDKIVKYERSDGGVLLLSGGQQIPVSVRKRESLTKMLSKL